MPVRSLNSPLLKWPDRVTVEGALRDWANRQAAARSELRGIAYFGSYARGDWSVGSDIDLVAVVNASSKPFESRAADWDVTGLPVPADLMVYTVDEWRAVSRRQDRFARVLNDAIWVCGTPPNR